LDGSWIQRGDDINGASAVDSVLFLSLSSDGMTVAIGSNGYDGIDGTSTNIGRVQLYRFFEGSWFQVGGDIVGESAGDDSGTSVSLSADGMTVAIGAVMGFNLDPDISYAGYVRVYQFESTDY